MGMERGERGEPSDSLGNTMYWGKVQPFRGIHSSNVTSESWKSCLSPVGLDSYTDNFGRDLVGFPIWREGGRGSELS